MDTPPTPPESNAAPVRLSLAWGLSALLERYPHIKRVNVTRESGMSPNTVASYYDGLPDRFNLSNIEHLLNTLRRLTGDPLTVWDIVTIQQTAEDGSLGSPETPGLSPAEHFDPEPKPRPTNPNAPVRIAAMYLRPPTEEESADHRARQGVDADPLFEGVIAPQDEAQVTPEVAAPEAEVAEPETAPEVAPEPQAPEAAEPEEAPAEVAPAIEAPQAAAPLPRELWIAARWGLGKSTRVIGAAAQSHGTTVLKHTGREDWDKLSNPTQKRLIAKAAPYFA